MIMITVVFHVSARWTIPLGKEISPSYQMWSYCAASDIILFKALESR